MMAFVNIHVAYNLGDEVFLHGKYWGKVIGYIVGMNMLLYHVRYSIGDSVEEIEVEEFELTRKQCVFDEYACIVDWKDNLPYCVESEQL
jgi:hypothetical protein